MIEDGPLDELAARFVVPAKSGVYVTKNELIGLARVAEGSLRVNERRRMLADVLKSPASLEDLAALIGRLAAITRAHRDHYVTLLGTFPLLKPHLQPWVDRAEATLARLEEVREDILD